MCIHQSAWFTLKPVGFFVNMIHLADTGFLFHVDSLLYDGFLGSLVHLRVRVDLPR